jgi:anti-sigma-K factor RskA
VSDVDRPHDEIRDDIAAYALGALPDADARTLESHLDECETCRERLRWLGPAVDLLPASVEQRRPPDRLREQLLEAVRAETAHLEASGEKAKSRWSFGWPAFRPAVALGAAAVLAIGIGLGYGIGDGETGEVLAGADVSQVEELRPGEIEGTLERQGELATLNLEGMPKLRRDQVYEVWIDRDGKLEPSTLFVIDSERRATTAISDGLTGADRILVTAEPRGGSETPTGAPLLKAQL